MPLEANALTTKETVKSFLKINEADTSQDILIEMLINAVSSNIEVYCNRRFGQNQYTDEVYSGNGDIYLILNQFPVLEVAAVKIDNEEVTDYELKPDSGILFREASWPEGERNIKVSYKAGYVLPKDDTEQSPRTLPHDLELACIIWVMYLFERKDSFGKDNERIEGISYQYSKQTLGVNVLDAPPEVLALINLHRKLTV